MKHSIEFLEKKAFEYRKRFLELFTTIGFGHVTSAFSWTEIATVLYHEIMNETDGLPQSDKLFVSKGHGAGMLFPIFEDLGYFSKEEMDNIVCIGGDTTKLRSLFYPGFDFYGGSLGIGLGCAAGMAKAGKINAKEWNVYCIVGDAENYEGSIWEAAAFSGFQKLDNLITIVDRNRLGCSDFTEHMLAIESLSEKWKAFNWEVYEVDGHNVESLYEVLNFIKNKKNGKPHCIIANTNKGQGLNYLIDKPLMHGYMPKGKDIEKAFYELELNFGEHS